jgi:hypothetical protein
MFGAKGMIPADDTSAIQSAADWLCSRLKPPFNFEFRKNLSPGLFGEFFVFVWSVAEVLAIEMHGAIKPDGGIGDAFTINDAVGCDFKLNVIGEASALLLTIPV